MLALFPLPLTSLSHYRYYLFCFIGNPYNDPHIKGDPFRTLFVSNLAYTTDEKALKESLQVYGRIRRIRIITDQKTQKPKGYAFVEFDNESDF